MRVFAVVVNWNGGASNLACLRALAREGDAIEHVVFVDNASTDGSRERVLSEFPAAERPLGEGAAGARFGLECIANERNEGYAGGNNRGIERALARGAEAVLVLNNDVELDAGCVATLVAALEAPGAEAVGLVGPRVVHAQSPDRLWAAGGMLTWRHNLTTLLGQGQLDGPAWRATRTVDYVPGCCLLVRRAVFVATGGFEEHYFAYTEDVDLGLTARALGWRSVVVGEARVLHDASSSTGGGYNPRRKFMMGVNSVWFVRRHANLGQWVAFFVFDVLSLPFVWLAGLPRGRGKAVLAKAWGIARGLRGGRVEARLLEPGSTWLW